MIDAQKKEGEMSWKSLIVLVAMLAFSASLMAQDKQIQPFLGIWEINVQKTANYPQQSQMIINVPTADGKGIISTRGAAALSLAYGSGVGICSARRS